MAPRAGFEPATLSLEVSCSIQLSYQGLVRDTGVEPVSKVWKTFILTAIRIPLNPNSLATSRYLMKLKKYCIVPHTL
jgi:hypothetical protein